MTINEHTLDHRITARKTVFDKRYILLAIAWLVLCALFPYTGDDWAWGSSIGIERLATWFDNYSGRYFGNIIVLILTRSVWIRTIVMAFVLTGIVYCGERLTGRKWSFVVMTIGILLVPRLIFRQAIVWTAGFSNYSTSIFLTLIFFIYLNEHDDRHAQKELIRPAILLLLLGLANTLIVENFTIFHVVCSIAVVLFYLLTSKCLRIDYLGYCAGCIAGAALMFSNSVYSSISANEDGYRSVGEGGIFTKALENYFGVIYREAFSYNWFINTLILFCCIWLALYLIQSGRMSKRITRSIPIIGLIIIALFWAASISVLIRHGYDYQAYQITGRDYVKGTLAVAALIAMIVVSLIVTYRGSLNRKLLLYWITAVVLIGPLFIAKPIGSRCFFGTYILLLLIACELMKALEDMDAVQWSRRGWAILGLCILIGAFVGYCVIFTQIHRADADRLAHVRSEVKAGSKSVDFPHLPHEEFLWTATPFEDNDIWEERYKLFYGIPEDVDLIIETQEE